MVAGEKEAAVVQVGVVEAAVPPQKQREKGKAG
jgi:hypothetical protein